MHFTASHSGIVILAAGSSSRLGSPKQLLQYQGKSLIRRSIDIALQTSLRPVLLVVGANKNLIEKEVENEEIILIENKDWQEGMAASLRIGLKYLQNECPDLDGILFMVCDQPFVTKAVIDCLVETQAKSGLPIAASSYEGRTGTPALFHKSFFEKLMALKGDTGARKLIELHKTQVAIVPFEKGIIDIDTKADYERLLQ